MLDVTECRFHHIGIACRDLDAEARPWKTLGYTTEAADFDDPVQQVRGRFLVGPGPRLELLVATASTSAVAATLARGSKIYHQGYTVRHIHEIISRLRADGSKLMVGPVPGAAFGGRQIAFLMMPNLNLIELIED